MTSAQIIVLATPAFLVAMAVEALVGMRRGRNTWRLHDAATSVGLGMLSQVAGVFSVLLMLGIYEQVHARWALAHWPLDAAWAWVAALLLYDLCYYALHRAGHRVALLWAAHVVHHQSEDYNLSTALRQTGSNWVAGWLFYLPLALLGVPPLMFVTVGLVDLLYQFWVHTQQVGRLGWFDRWFCSPSNHRVHHGVNDRYLDCNYGGLLMVWDRLFGSFVEEDDAEPVVYGARTPLQSFNPLWANLQVYASLARDCWHTRAWGDKLRVWFMPPGWRPADVAARFPKPAFRLEAVQRFDPALGRAAQAAVLLLFVAALAATALLLWHFDALAVAARVAGALGVLALLCAMGWVAEGRGFSRR